MSNSTISIESVKQDLSALLTVLNIDRPGKQRCPFHADRNASLSVMQNDSGVWRWKCFAGCGQGSIVDALALAEGISDGEAIQRLTGNAAPALRKRCHEFKAIAPKPEPILPVPDSPLVSALFTPAFENILEGRAADRLKFRGIDSFAWFEKHPILGFADRLNVPGWKYPLRNAWLFLVTDLTGNYLAVKVHREKPHTGPKSCWLPVGTEPPGKPRHGIATFWPPPEWFKTEETLFLCPGELKAAAVIAAGLNATSPTAGESHQWTPGQVERFKNRRVFVLYDDDPAGHKFRDNTLAALQFAVTELKANTFGQKAKK